MYSDSSAVGTNWVRSMATDASSSRANGPLARLDDAAVAINLIRYVPTVEEPLFDTTG